MRPFLFRCPNTGLNVQAIDDVSGRRGEQVPFRMVHCLACRQVHLISEQDCHFPENDPPR